MFIVPFTRPATLSRSLERWLDDRLFDPASAPRSPALDLSEDDKAYTVTLDLPGVAKEALINALRDRHLAHAAR